MDAEAEACCCICFNNYCAGEELRRLPCSHQFHRRCVDAWLQLSAKCPICRQSAAHGRRASEAPPLPFEHV